MVDSRLQLAERGGIGASLGSEHSVRRGGVLFGQNHTLFHFKSRLAQVAL